jgi:choloylglycine hydrolase
MGKTRSAALVAAFLAITSAGAAAACTTFCLRSDGEWVFGKNLDWMVEKGIIVVNKRGMAKASSPDSGAVRWVSDYGSVTFNMYGRELPMGGMNEAGLVIENMHLGKTEYPAADARPAASELQWVQYQLDTAATVEEVIESDSKLRIEGESSPGRIHFLVSDSRGGGATIEFLYGKMVYHTGEELPAAVLTNSPYYFSLYSLNKVRDQEPDAEPYPLDDSLDRFCRAASMVDDYSGAEDGPLVDYAFATLDSVSNNMTQWSVVYYPAKRMIYFKTKSNQRWRFFSTAGFDYSCETPVKVLDINAASAGDVSQRFAEYTYEMNYEQISHAFSRTGFLRQVPEETLRSIAAMPERMQCVR